MVAIDHLLLGVLLGFSEPTGDPHIKAAVICGSVFPDLDTLVDRPGTIGYLVKHRTYSHSLFGAPFYSLFISLSLLVIGAHTSIWILWIWTLAGILFHILVDIINSFGTMIWYPLRRNRIAFDTIFEFDIAITGIIGISIIIQIISFNRWDISSYFIGFCCAGCITFYILLRSFNRALFRKKILAISQDISDPVVTLSVVPAKYWKWKGIIATLQDHHIIREKGKVLEVEIRPIIQIPSAMLTKETEKYKCYARHLDVVFYDQHIELQNLIYSPLTYRLKADFSNTVDPLITISLPTLKASDY